MDEIDAIGGRRFSEGTSADREIQRTLMELLNQMDGFDVLGKVKMIMATNRYYFRNSNNKRKLKLGRWTAVVLQTFLPCFYSFLIRCLVLIHLNVFRPDTLDPALLRPGRLDRKIEISLPNDQARLEILKIHSGPITKHGEIDYEAVVKLSDGFNGADLR